MNHSTGLSRVREQLVAQLVLLGDEKNRFLDAYFVMHGKERTEISQFLSLYTQTVQKLLSDPDSLADEGLHSQVLIGSYVTFEYPDFDTKDSFTIVLPDQADPDENLISFLSPVGRQLLLAHLGDLISVAAPSGAIRTRIAAITFTGGNSSMEGGEARGS
ncbi:GreA/GreB family elongation factor [Paenibacillus paridis]|jgi:transcription elongation factor GreA|uniref:GreA/GreB family elongation factor n=1 Tax=Paenibacillus paridis TaxID=2583376 RepID=UPI00111F18BC|nr:GreA/GreB family elongation factor [Paenibacillus paridis]